MLNLLQAIYESIADRAAMHLGPLVGAAAALVADFFFAANSQIQIAIVLSVAIVAREAQEASRYGSIRDCKHAIASYVRSVLDTPLDITRFDRVHFGDYLTLRRIGNRARAGGIASVAASGGPSDSLAEAVGALSLSLEAEVGRCYGKLRGRDQARIDAFATALKRAGATARTLISPPFDETYEATVKKLNDSLAGPWSRPIASSASAWARAASAAPAGRRRPAAGPLRACAL